MRASLLARFSITFALGLMAVTPAACSSDDGGDGSGGGACTGVIVNGECQKECDPAGCLIPGSICYDNACAQPCPNGNADCPLGTRCELFPPEPGAPHCAIYPFGHEGKTGQNEPCTSNNQCDTARGWLCEAGTCSKKCSGNEQCDASLGEVCDNGNCIAGGTKKYEPCTKSTECAQSEGFACVDGECRVFGCRTHDDCAVLGECQPGTTDAGEKVLACVKATTYPPGQFGTKCPGGPTGNECDAAANFVCIGAGTGDIDAYCTMTGCLADSDCATGYFCSTVRTSRVPCQTACGITGAQTATCVPADQIGDGKEYSCGPVGLLRNLCLKKEYCNECETDADCLGVPNQICSADIGGRKICTVVCDPLTNSCPWGNASTCGDWDQDGVNTCSHRFETGCVGSGKSCEPCLDDADCPTGLCLQSDFTDERYCVDLTPSCSCEGLPTTQNVLCTGGGCPTTPGGLPMNCYGGSQVPPTSPLHLKCVGANVNLPPSSPQTGCWPAN